MDVTLLEECWDKEPMGRFMNAKISRLQKFMLLNNFLKMIRR